MKRFLPENRPLRSVYFGGGTPSYFPVENLVAILAFIKNRSQINSNTEITLETNPGTIAERELTLLRTAGFNRLSIGLQVTQDHLLKSIGRIHSWVEFKRIFNVARAAGFNNIGIDLIFGLPGQTVPDWRETLELVTELKPEHVSAYGLQLEPGTKMAEQVDKGLIQLPCEEVAAEMMNLSMDYLPGKGYQQYEISNYANPGFFSVHNLGYWQGFDYLGVGAGAYSTINGERWFNHERPEVYLKSISAGITAVAEREEISAQTAANEALMLGLRLRAGINLGDYTAKYGINLLKTAGPYVERFLEQQLLELKGDNLALTNAGILISNYVIGALLLD